MSVEVDISPEILEALLTRGRDEIQNMEGVRPCGQAVGVVEQHAMVESALVLEPSLLDGLDPLPTRVALVAPFYVKGGGSQVRPGPVELVRLGAREGSFSRRNAAVRDEGTHHDDWERMYVPLQDRGLGEIERTNTKAAIAFRLHRAPGLNGHRVEPTHQWRKSALIRAARIPFVMIPTRYIRDPNTLRALSAREIRLLFALHALSDRNIYGGVDPNHLRIIHGRLILSPDLRERMGDAEGLLSLLVRLERLGELRFVPADVRELEFFPAARPHFEYVGDDAESASAVVRLTRSVVRGDLQ